MFAFRWLSIAIFFLTCLFTVNAVDINEALRRRQVPPLGTGPSASISLSSASSSPSRSSASNPAPDSSLTTTSSRVTSTPSSSSPTQPQSSSTVSSSFGSPSATSTTTTSSSGAGTALTTLSVSTQTRQVLTTVVTVSGSSTLSQVLTTSALVAVTGTPSLNSNQEGGSSGVTASQKRIIIGVVVGVGGAALLGAFAVVAWRLWGRKKTANDTGSHTESHPSTSSSGQTNAPFKSTLDQYHKPTGPVNPSSNF